MKVKNKFLLLIISSLLLLIVFVVYKQYDNIKALYISSIFSTDDIKAKLEDNKEKLDKYISIVEVDKTETEDKDNFDDIQEDVINNQNDSINDISNNIVSNNKVNDNKKNNNYKNNETNNNNKNRVDASNKGQNLTSENKHNRNSDNSNLENTKTNKASNNKNTAMNGEDKNNKKSSNSNIEDKTNGNNTDKNNTDDNSKGKTDDKDDKDDNDDNDIVNKDKDNNCLSKDVIISKYINKMYAVKNEFIKKLKEIEKLAITEYSKLNKKDKTIKNKKDIVMKYYDLVANLEVQCDNKVNNLMIKLTEELKNIGEDTEIVKEIKDYYQNEKTLKKAYYIKKLNKKTD